MIRKNVVEAAPSVVVERALVDEVLAGRDA